MDKKNIEMQLQKALALNFVKEYCIQNGYSFDILSSQNFAILYDECLFFHSSNITPNGLLNDMETLPHVVLVIKYDGEKIFVVETEYTKKYLLVD